MRYSEQQYINLITAVEDQGGEHRDEMCSARSYTMTGKQGKPVTLPGCGNTSIFSLPYDATDSLGSATVASEVVVCAVCDDMGLWARFIDQVFG